MARRSGLGRGLDALIPAGVVQSSTSALRDVPISSIRPNQFQPRTQFDEGSLSALVDSIRAIGVLQPVLLRETAPGAYELIAGERRWRASRRAGLQTIPALIQIADDVSSLEQALVENLHREDLNALDEAAAYQQLIEEFHLTHEDVARRVGKSRSAITNSLRLFQLPTTVQRLVRDAKLTPGHARALLATPDRELQERLAQDALVAGMSVRALEELVRTYTDAENDSERFAPMSPGPETSGKGLPADNASVGTGDGTDDPVMAEVFVSAGHPDEADDERPEVQTPHPADFAGDAAVTGGASLLVHGRGPTPIGAKLRPPGFLELEELLANHLNTRVRVEMGAHRGRIVVDFATLEDLERIYRAMIGSR